MEDARIHCERCSDDEEEPLPQQQRGRGDGPEARTWERVEFPVDRVSGPGGDDEGQAERAGRLLGVPSAVGTSDEAVCEVTRCFTGECRAAAAWKILPLVLLEEFDAGSEKGIRERGVRAIALMSVLARWCAVVVVGMLQEEPLPLHPNGGEPVARGSERDWVPGFLEYQTMFSASLDVRTVFDVAKLSVVSRILTSRREGERKVQAHVVALLEKMKDIRGPLLSRIQVLQGCVEPSGMEESGQVRAVKSGRNWESNGERYERLDQRSVPTQVSQARNSSWCTVAPRTDFDRPFSVSNLDSLLRLRFNLSDGLLLELSESSPSDATKLPVIRADHIGKRPHGPTPVLGLRLRLHQRHQSDFRGRCAGQQCTATVWRWSQCLVQSYPGSP